MRLLVFASVVGFFSIVFTSPTYLFRFFVQRVFSAKLAIFAEFNTIGVVLFVLHRVVIPLLAFRTGKRDSYSHLSCPRSSLNYSSYGVCSLRLLTAHQKKTARGRLIRVSQFPQHVNMENGEIQSEIARKLWINHSGFAYKNSEATLSLP